MLCVPLQTAAIGRWRLLVVAIVVVAVGVGAGGNFFAFFAKGELEKKRAFQRETATRASLFLNFPFR